MYLLLVFPSDNINAMNAIALPVLSVHVASWDKAGLMQGSQYLFSKWNVIYPTCQWKASIFPQERSLLDRSSHWFSLYVDFSITIFFKDNDTLCFYFQFFALYLGGEDEKWANREQSSSEGILSWLFLSEWTRTCCRNPWKYLIENGENDMGQAFLGESRKMQSGDQWGSGACVHRVPQFSELPSSC